MRAVSRAPLNTALESKMRLASLLLVIVVGACARVPMPGPLAPETPQAKLRVAANAGVGTNITFMRVPEMACSSGMTFLGWFHPGASGDWQRDRRHYGLRQRM